MQKKGPLFEFPSFLLPTNLGQLVHSQSALTELPSPNFSPFILLDPLVKEVHTPILSPFFSRYSTVGSIRARVPPMAPFSFLSEQVRVDQPVLVTWLMSAPAASHILMTLRSFLHAAG